METIELDISDDDFLALAKIAHEKDITFNKLINDILRRKIELEAVNKDK